MDNMNPLLLHIETATDVCSVAITLGNEVLSVCESNDGNSHSKNLLPYIDESLTKAGRSLNDLDGVVVSVGPGSYTGLRIGVSTAKSIAYNQEIPVITVGTLESIASGAVATVVDLDPETVVVPMIDARRMEVFTAQYTPSLSLVEDVQAKIVDEHTFADLLMDKKTVFCGNGMPKCKEILSTFQNSSFVDAPLSAKFMLPVALKKWKEKDFADVAYFEPFYLKEYVAAKPNVKGLR